MIYEIIMPKMGESVQEATITKLFVKEGDMVQEDDILFEIATDKVDSEIPSPVEGKIKKINYNENDLVAVGKVVALIAMNSEDDEEIEQVDEKPTQNNPTIDKKDLSNSVKPKSSRFYSPLVKNIATKENISLSELDTIAGTGRDGRVNKKDLLEYIEKKENLNKATEKEIRTAKTETVTKEALKTEKPKIKISIGAEDTIIEMDRMRRLISDHMVDSVRISPHVTSMVEADVTDIVLWRNKVKDAFLEKEGVKLTFTPIFIEATAKALKDFPMINTSVDGYNIIKRKHINIGVAVALANNNLIVPVIKDADYLNLTGIAKKVDSLVNSARSNKLSPDDIEGGTFTITNFGSFRNVMGTPIINQPQTAILATGSIEKKPAVIETPTGDIIGIRHKIFLSLSYDHRVIDGALGGAFLRRIADYLENFDVTKL